MAVAYYVREEEAGVFNPVFSSISSKGSYSNTQTGASGLTRSSSNSYSGSTGFTNPVSSSYSSTYGTTRAYNDITRGTGSNSANTGLTATVFNGGGSHSYMRNGSVGKGKMNDFPEQSTTYEPRGTSMVFKNSNVGYNYNKLKNSTSSYFSVYPKISFSTETSVSSSYRTSKISEPYLFSILTKTSKYTESVTSTESSSYSSTYSSKAYGDRTDGERAGLVGGTTTNGKFESYYFLDYVFSTDNNGYSPMQLWVYENGTGVFSDCYRRVNGNYTIKPPYASSSKSDYIITYTDAEGTSDIYSGSVLETLDFDLNKDLVTNEYGIFATYSFITGSDFRVETDQILVGQTPTVAAINEDALEAVTTTVYDVIYNEVSLLSSVEDSYSYSYSLGTTTESRTFNRLYTTKAYSFPQLYTKTVESKTEKSWGIAVHTSSATQSNWTVRGGGGSTAAYGRSEYFTILRGYYTLPVVQDLNFNDVGGGFLYTCKTLPDGFIGFAGTFDTSFTTKKEAYRSIVSEKNGRMFKGAVEFNLFDLNPQLFAQVRKNGTVIIPQTYQEFKDFTVSAAPLSTIKTSAEFSVYYSTTSISTTSTDASFISYYTETGITKERGAELYFRTGQTTRRYSYSVSTSSRTNTTATLETIITYKYSLTDKRSKTYFTVGDVDTTAYHFSYDETYSPIANQVVTYGMAGGVGYGNYVMSIRRPALLKCTLAKPNGETQKKEISFYDLSKKRLLTLEENEFMYFEAYPIYTTAAVTFENVFSELPMYAGYYGVYAEYINHYE